METAEISGAWRPTDFDGPRLDRSSWGLMVSIDAGSSQGIGPAVSTYSDTDDVHDDDDDDVSPVQRITDTHRRKGSCWHEFNMRDYTLARLAKRCKPLRLVDDMSSNSMGIRYCLTGHGTSARAWAQQTDSFAMIVERKERKRIFMGSASGDKIRCFKLRYILYYSL
jgi:hypothetical protein